MTMARKKWIEAAPVRRQLLVDAVKTTVTSPVQGVLDLSDGAGLSPWFPAKDFAPVRDGWYAVKGDGPFPNYIERLWFEVDEGCGGMWRVNAEDKFGCLHAELHADIVWQGLADPPPTGYSWRLPDAPYRARLAEA